MGADDDDNPFKALGARWGVAAAAEVRAPLVRRERFDCQACGACCCNTQRNLMLDSREYVEVTKTDELFKRKDLLQQLTVRNDDGQFHLKLVGAEQRCVNLDGDIGEGVGCEIYPLRPAGCRRVEAGDEECLRARRKFGLSLGLPDP